MVGGLGLEEPIRTQLQKPSEVRGPNLMVSESRAVLSRTWDPYFLSPDLGTCLALSVSRTSWAPNGA